MTARRLEALAAAMSILQQPQLARLARHSPLPNGMTFLLEAAVGDAAATADAAAATGRSEVTVRNAAGFFIEQVLLSPLADSYRILGAHSTSPEAELRRHMTLLMRWLHPDLVPHTAEGQRFDRSAYAARVTKAWDCLKTPERRAAYDAAIGSNAAAGKQGAANADARRKRRRDAYRRESLLGRILLRLAGRT